MGATKTSSSDPRSLEWQMAVGEGSERVEGGSGGLVAPSCLPAVVRVLATPKT